MVHFAWKSNVRYVMVRIYVENRINVSEIVATIKHTHTYTLSHTHTNIITIARNLIRNVVIIGDYNKYKWMTMTQTDCFSSLKKTTISLFLVLIFHSVEWFVVFGVCHVDDIHVCMILSFAYRKFFKFSFSNSYTIWVLSVSVSVHFISNAINSLCDMNMKQYAIIFANENHIFDIACEHGFGKKTHKNKRHDQNWICYKNIRQFQCDREQAYQIYWETNKIQTLFRPFRSMCQSTISILIWKHTHKKKREFH